MDACNAELIKENVFKDKAPAHNEEEELLRAAIAFSLSGKKDNVLTEEEVKIKKIESRIKKNRCPCCNKKVGLLGFTCRCGYNYCALHRLPEEHKCSFDHASLAKEILAKNNPKVVGDKLTRI